MTEAVSGYCFTAPVERQSARKRPGPAPLRTDHHQLVRHLRRAIIKAERKELIRLWRNNENSDEVMRHHEEILDYQEAQL
jgi:hypothetical protein